MRRTAVTASLPPGSRLRSIGITQRPQCGRRPTARAMISAGLAAESGRDGRLIRYIKCYIDCYIER